MPDKERRVRFGKETLKLFNVGDRWIISKNLTGEDIHITLLDAPMQKNRVEIYEDDFSPASLTKQAMKKVQLLDACVNFVFCYKEILLIIPKIYIFIKNFKTTFT